MVSFKSLRHVAKPLARLPVRPQTLTLSRRAVPMAGRAVQRPLTLTRAAVAAPQRVIQRVPGAVAGVDMAALMRRRRAALGSTSSSAMSSSMRSSSSTGLGTLIGRPKKLCLFRDKVHQVVL